MEPQLERVLMIDDDDVLCGMVTEFLALEGFAVTAANDGASGLEQALSGTYALVLLDVMLPRLSGFEVLRRVRAGNGIGSLVPVLMLTARGAPMDRVIGLEVGADDYLPKPFNERELVARIRAILRRSGSAPMPTEKAPQREVISIGDVKLDVGARTLQRGDEVLCLTAVEFDLLALLLRAAGSVVSREQMTRDVLDRKLESFDRSIDTHISRLRRKLGNHPHGGERVKTVRSFGYIYTLPAK